MSKFTVAQVNTYVTDAAAVYLEENKVTFLQILFANRANHAKYITRITLDGQIKNFAVYLPELFTGLVQF